MRKSDNTLPADVVPSRRRFVQSAVVGGVGAALLPALAGAREMAAAATAPPEVGRFELDELTIADLQGGMTSGKFTSQSLTRKYISRIEEVDRQKPDGRGPAVNSVIELNPDALAIAQALDQERKAKGARGPLHGIPVLIKDNIDTADRMQTTAGSLALVGSRPAKDSVVAQKLREAGAVILGKTNLSEWANIRSSHSVSGWSGRGGLTRNPYALDRNPCGSSSGSGAATAANLCALAVGTETDGSVVCPSSANGIVGIKPTLGLISRSGIIPIAHSQDTAGPMARTVRDAAILLNALAGADPRDAATAANNGKIAADYTGFLDPNGLRGARIGVARKYFGFSDSVDALMSSVMEEMKRQGAVLVDPADLETYGKFDDSEFLVLLYELKADLNAYLATRPDAAVHSLKDIIEFNERNKEKEMPYFLQDIFIKAEAKGPLTSKEYLDALEANHRLVARRGHRRAHGQVSPGRNHGADRKSSLAYGPGQRRSLRRREFECGGGGGISRHNRACGFYCGTAGGRVVLRAGLERAGLCLRSPMALNRPPRARKPPKFLPTVRLDTARVGTGL